MDTTTTTTPRVTCSYLNSYVGRNVIIVGKVIQLRGDEAIIDADGNITARLHRVSFLTPPFFQSLAHAHTPKSPILEEEKNRKRGKEWSNADEGE
jgi:hypothetical protein